MPAQMVPIPLDAIDGTQGAWRPFIEAIAKRARSDVNVAIANIRSGAVHLVLAWEPDQQRAVALAGIRFEMRGTDRIAEIIWLTGSGRNAWVPLLPEFERYLRDHQGCTGVKPICRPGWARLLKHHGYRTTHVVLEKEFMP